MRVTLIVLVVLLLGIAAAAAFWLRPAGPDASGPQAELPAPPPLVIAGLPPLPPLVASALATDVPVVAWVAHAGARLEPCGCVAGMHGGLVRRASLLTRLAGKPRLVVEGGGWSGGAADYQRLRTRTYLTALRQSGCDAIGLGAAEVRLGAITLRSLIQGDSSPAKTDEKRLVVPLACANVAVAEGTSFFRDRILVQVGDHLLTITSVVPATARGDGLTVEDPAQALLRLISTLRGSPLVVLADLDESGLLELAKAVPGIALLIGGDVKQPSQTPVAVGACRVVQVANEGKTIGYWPWGGPACAFELISDQVPDHPDVRAAIHAYQEHLGAMNLAIDERVSGLTSLGGGGDAGARYVGDQACTPCHANAAQVHGASKHAHAFASLERKGYHRDPDCLRCHVTGLGLPDGYRRNADPERMRITSMVSCESCHGRGSLHVAERAAGRPSSGSLTPVTPATCLVCHDRENSPRFAFDTYWEKVRHGVR